MSNCRSSTTLTEKVAEVAFVLPAFNEQKLLPATLDSVAELLRGKLSYEIVVVDNGSTDATVELARQHGATTLVRPGVTVGALRNYGARHCTAPVLVFLDADVVITREWVANIEGTLRQIHENPAVITGSACGVPPDAKWLERNWFGPWQTGRTSHMNSGHMIIARSVFERLGGFDERMQTGEDYEFSIRAQKAGIELVGNPSLAVIHNGYPKTLGAFMRREVWHGRSDFESFSTIIASPIAVATFAFALSHVLVLTGAVIGSAAVAGVGLAGVIAICIAVAIRQYRHQNSSVILSNAGIYYFYFTARFIAFLKAQFRRNSFVHRERR